MIGYFGSPCAPYISTIAAIYTSLPLRRLVGLPIFVVVVRPITSLTICLIPFLTSVSPHSCFTSLQFSGGNITLMICRRVAFGTQNSSRISEYLDLTIILISQAAHISHSVYDWSWSDVRKI